MNNCVYSAQGFIICTEHFEQKEEFATVRQQPALLASNNDVSSVNVLCKGQKGQGICKVTPKTQTGTTGTIQCFNCINQCTNTNNPAPTSKDIKFIETTNKKNVLIPLSLYHCDGKIVDQPCPQKCAPIEKYQDIDFDELQNLTTKFPSIAQTFTPVITQETYNVSQEKPLYSVPPKPNSIYSVPKNTKQEFTLT